MSSHRFARIVRKIVTEDGRSGLARVLGTNGLGKVLLDGRDENVLVVGNAIPETGELAPWIRVDEGTLVTCKSLPVVAPKLFAPSGREWEQILITDLATYGYNVDKVFHIWEDGYGHWWASVEHDPSGIYDNPIPQLFRGDWSTSPWDYKGSVPDSRRGYVVGHGNNIFAVYWSTSIYSPVVRSRQGVIASDGSITWGAEISLTHPALIEELRYPHMMRDPLGYIWFYNAPRAGGDYFRRLIWRSTDPDSLAGGWTLQHQSDALGDDRPTGFLASNGNRCVLLRMRQLGFVSLSCYMETSADWAGTPVDLGFPGLIFRHVWWSGKWWLTYGAAGLVYYLSNGLFYIEGGTGDTPVWGTAYPIAPAGISYYGVLPYGNGDYISAIYFADSRLWHANLPDLEEEGESPRIYEGNFPVGGSEVYPLPIEPRSLAAVGNPVVMWEGHRVWAARMVEA